VSLRKLQPARVHAALRRGRELLVDLDELVGEPTAEELTADRARRHITERILSQLVELAVSVNSHLAATLLGEAPADYRSSFDLAAKAGAIPAALAADLRDAAGLRNVLVHAYLDVDLGIVAAAVPRARSGFSAYVREVAEALQRHLEADPS
jgi:uncharacterized protein YutE (UPF0331/DUF86 family)